MSAERPTEGAALVRQRAAGIAFLGVLAGLVGLTIAMYNKVFTPVVHVSLEVDRAGTQLTPPADVKIRGVTVGEVREVDSRGDIAVLDLALDADQVGLIPSNVQAQVLPKTLFGEKFVQLVVPEDPAAEPIEEGEVITLDRSQTSTEFASALNDLAPVLRTLRPEQLSLTLNAVSSALRGRGDQIGENLLLARQYLREFNPELPTLAEDFRGLADFSDTLTAAAPDLLSLLDDLSFVNRSLVDQGDELDAFLTSSTGSVEVLEDFLVDNEQRLITLANESEPVLELVAYYSPEFPCTLNGVNVSDEVISNSFGHLQPGLHITLEFTEARPGYQPGDQPEYLDTSPPNCFGLDDLPPPRPFPGADFKDGVEDGDTPREQDEETYPGAVSLSAQEGDLIDAVLAPVLGVRADEVPDVAQLLFGPVARGTTVALESSAMKEAS